MIDRQTVERNDNSYPYFVSKQIYLYSFWSPNRWQKINSYPCMIAMSWWFHRWYARRSSLPRNKAWSIAWRHCVAASLGFQPPQGQVVLTASSSLARLIVAYLEASILVDASEWRRHTLRDWTIECISPWVPVVVYWRWCRWQVHLDWMEFFEQRELRVSCQGHLVFPVNDATAHSIFSTVRTIDSKRKLM